MAFPRINPRSNAKLEVTVERLGVLQDTATAVADIYRPNGQLVSGGVPLNFVVSGMYNLFIDPLWSEDGAVTIEGLYAAIIVVTLNDDVKTFRARYLVDYSDDQEQ